MKIKSIPSKWLYRQGLRLDCGPYTSGGLEAQVILEELSAPTNALSTFTSGHEGGIYNGPHFSRTYVGSPEHGVPFLGSSSMLCADLSHLPLLKKEDALSYKLSHLQVRPGMTLISCSGTIGRMVFARPDMAGMWSSQHIMKIVPDTDKIPPGYLYAFLSSKYGVPLVVSGTYGAIIQSIEPQHIANLPVPRFGPFPDVPGVARQFSEAEVREATPFWGQVVQQVLTKAILAKALQQATEKPAQYSEFEWRVHQLVQQAAELLTVAGRSLQKATDTLFRSVGLEDMTAHQWHEDGRDLGFSASFPCAGTFRAVNFNPRYMRLCENIKKGSWRALGDLCNPGLLCRGGRYNRIDASREHAYQLVSQKGLHRLRPDGRLVARWSLGKEMVLEPGAIAVAARGTLGEQELYCRAEFVWGPWVENAYSEDILRIVADERQIARGCLFAFLRSETAFRMLRSISMGTKLQDHHHALLSQLPVPFPARGVQEGIHATVVDAYEKRHRAIALEDQAIALVESAIEMGGV